MDASATTLTTGWETLAPVDDSLLRQFLFHLVDQAAAVAVAGGGHALSGQGWAAADLCRPGGYWNAAVLLRPPDDWADVVDQIEGFFAGHPGQATLWSAWPTPDLRGRGWTLSGHPPVLVRPPDRLAPVADAPGDAALDVRPVTDAAGLAEWERAAVDGYPLPELQPVRPGSLVAPSLLDHDGLGHDGLGHEGYRFWVGYEEGRAVSASATYASRGLASLAFGATARAMRGRGHWHRHAVERLRCHPDVWMTGVFSDHSRPLARRIGFVPLQRLTLWLRAR